MQLGMIGLGRMGANMVKRLATHGHECNEFLNPKGYSDATRYANGRACGEDDRRRCFGETRTAFRYFDKGDMATIGRHMAVADVRWLFHARLSGYQA
jgi:6-phosphogluconate dehydrogenase (decarboxylating)